MKPKLKIRIMENLEKRKQSYREYLGLTLPIFAKVKVEHMAGVNWYILWIDCTDDENILYGWLSSRK